MLQMVRLTAILSASICCSRHPCSSEVESAGAVEQLLQDQVRAFNITALANARAIEQVIANFQVVEIRLQKHVRQEYKLALEDWRLLHTKHVIAKFVEDVNGTDCAKPLQCVSLIEDLHRSLQDAAAEMATCVLQDILALQNLRTPQSAQECDFSPVVLSLDMYGRLRAPL